MERKLSVDQLGILLAGFGAFVSGLLAYQWMISLVRNSKLKYFTYYFAVGSTIIYHFTLTASENTIGRFQMGSVQGNTGLGKPDEILLGLPKLSKQCIDIVHSLFPGLIALLLYIQPL